MMVQLLTKIELLRNIFSYLKQICRNNININIRNFVPATSEQFTNKTSKKRWSKLIWRLVALISTFYIISSMGFPFKISNLTVKKLALNFGIFMLIKAELKAENHFPLVFLSKNYFFPPLSSYANFPSFCLHFCPFCVYPFNFIFPFLFPPILLFLEHLPPFFHSPFYIFLPN